MAKKGKTVRLTQRVQLGENEIIFSKNFEDLNEVLNELYKSEEFTNGVSEEDYTHKLIVAGILQSGEYDEYHNYECYTDADLEKLS